jgi:hypothetical protein
MAVVFSPPGASTPFDDAAKLHLFHGRPIRKTPHPRTASPVSRDSPGVRPRADDYLRLGSEAPRKNVYLLTTPTCIYGTERPERATVQVATAPPGRRCRKSITHVAVVSTLGPDRGIAQLKVDGQLVATVDLSAATQQTAQVVHAINGLAPGVTHQVQVVVTSSKSASSTASKVDYDAILALK